MGKNVRRRRVEEEPAEGDSFTMLFVSLNIILLAFFVVINSIAIIDSTKWRQILRSFTGSVGGSISDMPGGVRPGEGADPLLRSSPISQGQVVGRDSEEMTVENLSNYIISSKLQYKVRINTEEDATTIVIADDLLFAPGGSRLGPSADFILNRIGSLIRNTTNDIVVEGHTDNVSSGNSGSSGNWELSGERTISVVEYFLKDSRISRNRLAAAGYGEFKPFVANDTPENRARNRRVSIVFLKKLQMKKTQRWRNLYSIKGFIFKLRFSILGQES